MTASHSLYIAVIFLIIIMTLQSFLVINERLSIFTYGKLLIKQKQVFNMLFSGGLDLQLLGEEQVS